MSLYNMLHGVNPFASFLLTLIGVDPDMIPRFRDCYVNDEGLIVIHTRTGGGNREHYEDGNEYLQEIEGYVRDEDDSFDCTYANFYYKPDELFKPVVDGIKEMSAAETPAEKWQKLFADLQAGEDNERVKRALEVGKPIIDMINDALKDK